LFYPLSTANQYSLGHEMSLASNSFALVVDDDPSFLGSLKLMLRCCGFPHIVTAEGGLTALDHLNDWRFDLIVSDWNMDRMDGIELLRRVRHNPLTEKTPFILVTASLTETAWRQAIEFGATEFIVKPFTLASLRSACHLCLALRAFEGSNIVPLKQRLQQRGYGI
jgi:CheY-like chemotaxis protein